MFSLALEVDRIKHKPVIKMLVEAPPRAGFLESDQFAAIWKRLPVTAQGIAEFAYLTGWRVNSEVVPLEWRQVNLAGGIVRLEPGMGKTGEPRRFPLTRALRTLLESRRKLTDDVQRKCGKVISFVFDDEGAPIKRFDKAGRQQRPPPGTRHNSA